MGIPRPHRMSVGEAYRLAPRLSGFRMVASEATAFDLIILDIGLADADGRVLARTLRETPHGEAAAILCVSGLGGQTREDGALAHGVNRSGRRPCRERIPACP